MDKFKMYQKGISIKSLYNMYYEDIPEVDFSDDMQRGEVWSNTRKSLYIHSILLKITDAQSPFIAGVRELPNGNTLLKIFDGKQRGTTIIHYIDGDFALTGLTNEPDIYLNGEPVKLQGKRFKQLPPKLQSWILDTTLNISIMENATPEQESLIFRRLNNGKSMSKFDIARSYKQGMEDIKELTNHELFNVMLTSTERKALKQQEIIIRSWIALFEESPNLTPAHVNEVMKVLSIDTDEREQLKTSYDFMFETYKNMSIEKENSDVIKLMFKPTHFIGYLPYLEKFDTPEQFAKWVEKFFGNMPEAYASLVREHTTSPSSIKARRELIEKSVNEFLGK